MKKIFVDTENISNYNCLSKIGITKSDEIILLLTSNSKSFKPDCLHLIHSFGANVLTVRCKSGKPNALDIQLACHLSEGYSKNNQYYIVSNDKDFEIVQEHFKPRGFKNISIIKETSTKSANKPAKSNKDNKSHNAVNVNSNSQTNFTKNTKVMNEIAVSLDVTSSDELEIRRLIKASSTKADFHNALVKQYKDRGRLLYKQYKSCF